ncbi:hypothetical protein ACFSQQ_16620 [Mesorhizobium kowhaii]|uniref:hypothetical protein n=1 Tax=Mesorhizobium kowhaii TaxID=1300272 RepID=UPI0035E81EB7
MGELASLSVRDAWHSSSDEYIAGTKLIGRQTEASGLHKSKIITAEVTGSILAGSQVAQDLPIVAGNRLGIKARRAWPIVATAKPKGFSYPSEAGRGTEFATASSYQGEESK